MYTIITDEATTDQWTCSRCTLVNKSSVDRCGVCEAPRRFSAPIVNPDPSLSSTKPKTTGKSGAASTWTCSSCTFIDNPSWGVICQVCNTPRPAGSGQPRKKPRVIPSTSGSGACSKGNTAKEKNRSASSSSGPGQGAPPRLQRLSSQCCEAVQASEEATAMEQWNHIVDFCKVVSSHSLKPRLFVIPN